MQLTALFNKYGDPAFPYGYSFADETYAAKFNLELLVGKLAGIFAALAILISCLGLLGLTAYVAEQQTRRSAFERYWALPYRGYGSYYRRTSSCWL